MTPSWTTVVALLVVGAIAVVAAVQREWTIVATVVGLIGGVLVPSPLTKPPSQ